MILGLKSRCLLAESDSGPLHCFTCVTAGGSEKGPVEAGLNSASRSPYSAYISFLLGFAVILLRSPPPKPLDFGPIVIGC